MAALDAIIGMYKVFKDNGMFLSKEQAAAALESVDTFDEHYAWLVHHGIANNRLLYPIVPKLHMMWHIADLSKWLNPTAIWCYDAEDYMHVVVTTARACIAGTPMHQVGNNVLQNYCLVLELLLRDQ